MDYIVWSANPILFTIGSVSVRWYGLLFALAFVIGAQIIEWIFRREHRDVSHVDHMFIYVIVATIVGARLGHCIFYDPSYYFANPLKILAIWEGGLASHGGTAGIFVGLYLFARKYNYEYIWALDRLAIVAALASAFIRLGNFFNSEILGTQTTLPWAIVFSHIDSIPRHPAQLYEAISYMMIFILLLTLYIKFGTKLKDGLLFGLLMLWVFGTRFMIEFVKVKQEAYSNDWGLSTGQFLSIPFVLLGIYMIFFYKAKKSSSNT